MKPLDEQQAEQENFDYATENCTDQEATSGQPDRQGQPVQAAPARVLRRLRRLRRDPLRQAGHPAVRRPHVYRQRHRLLLHLGRLRALRLLTPSTRRATAPPGRNSLFEDNAEFGFGMYLASAPAPRQAGRQGRDAVGWTAPMRTSRPPARPGWRAWTIAKARETGDKLVAADKDSPSI